MAQRYNLKRRPGQPALDETDFLRGYDPDLTSSEDDPETLKTKLLEQLGVTDDG